MKLLLLLLLLEFKPLCIVHAQSVRTLTQEQAWSIVQNEILGKKIDSINVYVSKEIVKANNFVPTILDKGYAPKYDSWFFFIDDLPFGNWGHPCRYVFVSIYNGEYVVWHHHRPPFLENMVVLILKSADNFSTV